MTFTIRSRIETKTQTKTGKEIMPRKMYLIDGVQVSRKIYFRRQLWGEYNGASFTVVEIRQRDRA
jgi:hypothetical protein